MEPFQHIKFPCSSLTVSRVFLSQGKVSTWQPRGQEKTKYKPHEISKWKLDNIKIVAFYLTHGKSCVKMETNSSFPEKGLSPAGVALQKENMLSVLYRPLTASKKCSAKKTWLSCGSLARACSSSHLQNGFRSACLKYVSLHAIIHKRHLYLGYRRPTANRTTPFSLSCAAAWTTLPWDLPSDKRMATRGTLEELRPPGKPFLRMYFRAKPVWVLPPLRGKRFWQNQKKPITEWHTMFLLHNYSWL